MEEGCFLLEKRVKRGLPMTMCASIEAVEEVEAYAMSQNLALSSELIFSFVLKVVK